jgi:hypothetical protein
LNTLSETFSIAPASTKSLFFVVPLLLPVVWAAAQFPALIFPLGFLSLIMFLVVAFPIYSSRKVGIQAEDRQIRIRGDMYGRNITVSSLNLAMAKIVNLDEHRELRPKWRTNGIGLPGYQAGWFKLADGEKALLFVIDPKAVVYVPTDEGYALLVSVAEAPRFLASLKKQA